MSAPAVRRSGWVQAYRPELIVFAATFCILAGFSGTRLLRQSAAPHFVYQARAWLEGRLDIDPAVLPNYEDWACVREVGGKKVRCEGRVLPSDRWYVSFPPFPALAMLPFVALHGYQLNDTSFTVIVGALSVALFALLIRRLSELGELSRSVTEARVFAATLAFGTLFFYCAIRGEVWFTAEIMGVGLTALYLSCAVQARRPLLAGLFFSMATLTRAPLLFSGIFFVLEVLCPLQGQRWKQVGTSLQSPGPALRKLGLFALGAAPLALAAAVLNVVRFGQPGEFGHRFFYNNRVNVDIDRHGLFDVAYLRRNLEAAFLKLPEIELSPFELGYDPHGLSLWLTLPVLVLALVPATSEALLTLPKRWLAAALVSLPLVTALVMTLLPRALRLMTPFAALVCSAPFLVPLLFRARTRRLTAPLWITVALCALPGLFYQNTGYAQFGFRFSLDYTPHLLLLVALSGWRLESRWVQALLFVGFVINFWGAVAFQGYTEFVRRG